MYSRSIQSEVLRRKGLVCDTGLAANTRAELKNSETAEAPVLFSRSMNQQTVTFLMGLSLLYILSSHCLDLNIQSDFRNPEPGPRLHNSTNN